jgi:uncharacterized protein (DUF952 family)
VTRWLYHALVAPPEGDLGDPYAPASLDREGFVHASFASAVHESVALYFPPDAPLLILQIDPRRLPYAVDIVDTPRGPMPHLPGPVPRATIVRRYTRDDLPAQLPDQIG